MPARSSPDPRPVLESEATKLQRLLALREQWRKAQTEDTEREHARYAADPVAWAKDYLGVHLWSRQAEIAQAVVEHRQIAVQSAAGIGKTYLAAILALWFGSTRPRYKTKIVTTAPTADQVNLLLWGEIRKQHDAAHLPGRVLMNNRWLAEDDRYVLGYGRKPPDHSGSAFQGEHEEHMLIIVDEAGGIGAKMWADIRAQSTGQDVTVLAIGNPDDNSSTFHDMCSRPDSGWYTIKVSVFDTPNFTGEEVPDEVARALPSRQYVEEARAAWGEGNPFWVSKIMGNWADAEDGLIPSSWITQAVRRWMLYFDTGHDASPAGRRVYGVDVARYGSDKTVIAERQGEVVYGLDSYRGKDNVEVADLVDEKLAYPGSFAIVDSDGLGGGVVDILRHRGKAVVAFSAGAGTRRRDSTGTQRFTQVRSAAWYHMRELLNPALGSSICLPPDPTLQAELAAPRWPEGPSNIIQIERKVDIRKRLGRSTDHADAVVQAFWVESPPEHEYEPEHVFPAVAYYVESGGFDIPDWLRPGGIDWD